jgi:hypothetical protein
VRSVLKHWQIEICLVCGLGPARFSGLQAVEMAFHFNVEVFPSTFNFRARQMAFQRIQSIYIEDLSWESSIVAAILFP